MSKSTRENNGILLCLEHLQKRDNGSTVIRITITTSKKTIQVMVYNACERFMLKATGVYHIHKNQRYFSN